MGESIVANAQKRIGIVFGDVFNHRVGDVAVGDETFQHCAQHFDGFFVEAHQRRGEFHLFEGGHTIFQLFAGGGQQVGVDVHASPKCLWWNHIDGNVEANGVAIGILDGKVRIEIGSRQVEPFQRFAHIAPNV